MLYAVEMERERRRQHMTLIRQLDNRRKYEEREKKKHQVIDGRDLLGLSSGNFISVCHFADGSGQIDFTRTEDDRTQT